MHDTYAMRVQRDALAGVRTLCLVFQFVFAGVSVYFATQDLLPVCGVLTALGLAFAVVMWAAGRH